MDNERLEAIKARRAAITQGVWEWHELTSYDEPVDGWYTGLYAMNEQGIAGLGVVYTDGNDFMGCGAADATFIENAPQDIDYLLSLVAILETAKWPKMPTTKRFVDYPLESGGTIRVEVSEPGEE